MASTSHSPVLQYASPRLVPTESKQRDWIKHITSLIQPLRQVCIHYIGVEMQGKGRSYWDLSSRSMKIQVHTSVITSVGAWPAEPETVPSGFCWVKEDPTDTEDALWESEGCCTGIWLWGWLWDWACMGSWQAFFLLRWSGAFSRGGENAAGWPSGAKWASSAWLTMSCIYERQTHSEI